MKTRHPIIVDALSSKEVFSTRHWSLPVFVSSPFGFHSCTKHKRWADLVCFQTYRGLWWVFLDLCQNIGMMLMDDRTIHQVDHLNFGWFCLDKFPKSYYFFPSIVITVKRHSLIKGLAHEQEDVLSSWCLHQFGITLNDASEIEMFVVKSCVLIKVCCVSYISRICKHFKWRQWIYNWIGPFQLLIKNQLITT